MHPSLLSDTFAIATPTERSIEIRREFAAPRGLVWDAWTRPELLRRWYGGPSGWRLDECEIDLRVGGAWRYLIRHETGPTMALSGVYRVVEPGHLLVSSETNDDCDARAGGPEAVTSTELDDLADGRCLLVSTVLLATTELRDAMLASGMERGLVASYDRLDQLLGELGPVR
ncbi:MAG: SRPBCC family protein, partial [Marmoricola sp.]